MDEPEMDEPGLGEPEMDEPDLGEVEMGEHGLGEAEMDEPELSEHEMGEPEMEELGMFEYEVMLESESDSEDKEYVVESESSSVVSSFFDRENEILSSEDKVDEECNVNAGLGSDEVDVESESGHSDSLHSVDEADSDGAQRPRQTSTSSAKAPRISKLPTRKPRTTPTSHGRTSPRPTPLPTQPSQVHTVRWMPTPTTSHVGTPSTTGHGGTPPTTSHGGTSPRLTPLPTQPSQVHTVRWMSTPTTSHAGTSPTIAYGGTSSRPTPLPTQPSQVHTIIWMPTPTTSHAGTPQQLAMVEPLQGQLHCQLNLRKSTLLDGCPPQQQAM
ncbi:hypothetical protein V6N12_050891 [Hibiscus sabdariffa]|uniref:Uncharacterized protein n=1 Tax=Hibiscus sabdariffa TaxID=183260 RepID=A0ABR2GEJ4_9ROSI